MPEPFKKIILFALIAFGVVLSANLFIYLWEILAILGLTIKMLPLLAYFIIYITLQAFFVWYLYCHFKKGNIPKAPPGLKVDVFVTAYNEPMWIVRRALHAAKHITYPHWTYLLDDSPDEKYKSLADDLNTKYLTREGNLHYKAGNINAALKRTSGEFVAIFDIDHAPEPEFLDRTLGFFDDKGIGFVQVMETFCNADDNVIAAASVQTAVEYFNITAVCKDKVGATSLHGTNAVIRRKALETIDGYHPGLAEDLETSLDLHAKGWKSAYVCEPIAPGLSPASFIAFCKQQLKWSKGVFEAACRTFFDGTFFQLTLHQMLAYSVRFSYYSVGLSFFLGMCITLLHLFKSDALVYEGFLARLIPLTALIVIIRWFMLKTWGTEPVARKGVHFKGISLILSTWPIYLFSLICTLVRIRIPFISTPKDASVKTRLWAILPQIGMILALIMGIIWKILHWEQNPAPLTLLFGFLLILQQWILAVPIGQLLKRRRVHGFEDKSLQPEFRVSSVAEKSDLEMDSS
ncbi:MAG TPA: glycosyltransferase [Desulfobacterales bacterium]|nr:glycosyltransferase [Desulfobacterales bacterium]